MFFGHLGAEKQAANTTLAFYCYLCSYLRESETVKLQGIKSKTITRCKMLSDLLQDHMSKTFNIRHSHLICSRDKNISYSCFN